jgi:ribosomal protein S6--L-glutamate ligase
MEQENPGLLYRRRRLGEVDAVVPRIGASVTTFGTAVVRQFQQMGVFVANTANSIGNSRHVDVHKLPGRRQLAIPAIAKSYLELVHKERQSLSTGSTESNN